MNPSKQHGGIFLGLIIGLVLGLAAALGVAIYVAKVPVPFVNKSATRNASQDAAEAERNRHWDPNALLRSNKNGQSTGGVVAPQPPPALIPPQPESPVAAAEPSAPAQTRPVPAPAEVKPHAPSPATATARPAAADPLGELMAARASRPEPKPAAADPFAYFVQAGAFRSLTDADAQRARLSLMGVEARISEREQAGRTVYRVRVGPFQNQDAAERVKQRLNENSFDAALVRVQR